MRLTIGRSDVHMGDDAPGLVLKVKDDATIFDVVFAMHNAPQPERSTGSVGGLPGPVGS